MDAVEKFIIGQLEIMDVKKLTRAKNVLEIIKSSTRVKINKNDEMIYLDKVPTGIKASVFLYDKQQQNKKLQNPAFIMILSALNLNEQSVMNTYAKHAIKSAIATTAKIKSPTKQPTSVDSTNSPSSSSKTVKKRRGTKSTSLYQRGKKEDYPEDPERPITIRILRRQKRRRQKRRDDKPTPAEEKIF